MPLPFAKILPSKFLPARVHVASQLRYIARMKSATLPSIRVEQSFREELEASLREGESLSEFIESALRASLRHRAEQGAFLARGIAALEDAKRTGETLDSDVVLHGLELKLSSARRVMAARTAKRK